MLRVPILKSYRVKKNVVVPVQSYIFITTQRQDHMVLRKTDGQGCGGYHMNGLVRDCSICIANALEIL